MIDEEAVSPSKLFCTLTDEVREVDRLLIDDELLKGECHLVLIEKREGEWKVESRPRRAVRPSSCLLTTFSALLSIFSPEAKKSG